MKFTFGSAVAILLGLIVGGAIALIIIVRSIHKKVNKKAGIYYENSVGEAERTKVNDIIVNSKSQFRRAKRWSTPLKVLGIKIKKKKRDKNGEVIKSVDYVEIIRSIALVFNPNSPQPLLEMNEKQAFAFGHNVTAKLTDMLNIMNLPFISKINISFMLDSAGSVSAILKTKAVGRLKGAFGVIMRLINLINPFYWIKKIITEAVTHMLLKEIVFISIETVAIEFANLYSTVNMDDDIDAN